MTIDQFELVNRFGAAVEAGVGTLFVGAGLSAAAGLPTWPTLLAPLANQIGLSLRPNEDLPLIAEYFEQSPAGGRHQLEHHLLTALAPFVTPAPGHELVAALPVREVWTTNYDPLLELAIGDCTVAATDESVLTVGDQKRSVIKMHGSIEHAASPTWEARPIITRGDYERYEETHPRMWARLRASYLTRTMLFLGFSFTDPNVELLLRLARRYQTTSSSSHLTVLRRPTDPDELRLHELRVRDLEASGVQVHEIADFKELEPLLRAMVRRAQPPRFFISGSGDLSEIQMWCDKLALALADRPASWQIASLGGPAGWEMTKALSALRQAKGCYEPERLLLYFRALAGAAAPPLDARAGTAVFTNLDREPLVKSVLEHCRALLVVGGGAKSAEEVQWAQDLGLGIVPLAASGGTAKTAWERLGASGLPNLGGRPVQAALWGQLADTNATVAAMAAAQALDQAMYAPRP